MQGSTVLQWKGWTRVSVMYNSVTTSTLVFSTC